jgi:predicted DNA-binding ribbon-helix-helix protein
MSMERRHITVSTDRTTVGMEPQFWQAIESISGGEWHQWLVQSLADKPATQGRSSWLRCRVLMALQNTGRELPISLII